MFELISRRYEQKSTVVTTNRAFAEWREIVTGAKPWAAAGVRPAGRGTG
jgi:DNA replication protein DnaC